MFFPVHPRTRERLCSSGLIGKLDGCVTLSPARGYIENLALMESCEVGSYRFWRDAGGDYLPQGPVPYAADHHRGAPSQISHGTNTIVGDDLGRAYRAFDEVLAGSYPRGRAIPGWDGRASERIAATLSHAWGN